LNGEWELGLDARAVFDRRIVVPFCPQSELSSVREMTGDVVWYRRRFDAPRGERVLLHFGAVDYRAAVWLNDVELGRHEGGHVPFTFEVTRALRPHGNVLVVRAEDPLRDRTIPRGKQFWGERPEGIFYTPTSGIWQTVWLEPVPPRRIESLRVTPDLQGGAVDLEVAASGVVEAEARLEGAVAGRWSGAAGRARIRLDPVSAWHPDDPRLYELEVRLVDAGRTVDRVRAHFGMRSIGAREGRVLLNGEPFTPRLVLDQGYFDHGLCTAATDEDIRRDIELARSFGFDGARKHQKIEDPRWLYWADVLGFLVWEEMPSFHEHSPEAERRLAAEWRQAVIRDRSHPSIVAWVVANESFGLEGMDPRARFGFLERMYRMTHRLDGTRPVISNDGWQHARSDLCTIHDYSPAGALRERCASRDSLLRPGPDGHSVYAGTGLYAGEPLIVSEFGGLRVDAPGGWGWLSVPDRPAFVREYGRLVRAILDGPVAGFCYTQLYDVEQEQNGLLTAERRPKVDPKAIRRRTRSRAASRRGCANSVLDTPGRSQYDR
jgi:beta-galactosidase/beta-glucuronidase